MTTFNPLRKAVLAASLSLAAALLLATPSFASQGYLFQTSMGSFASAASVATDSVGNAYVYDPAEGTVSKFSPSGTPLEFAAGVPKIEGITGEGPAEVEIAVDKSAGPAAGDIYVANGSAVHVYSPEGTPLEELTPEGFICGVATDASGNVYVSRLGSVNKYTPATSPVTNADLVSTLTSFYGLDLTCNIAVDSAGDLYGASLLGGVLEFAAGDFGTEKVDSAETSATGTAVAISPADDVYVDEGSEIVEYGPEGARLSSTAGEPSGEEFGESTGLSVSPTGQMFVIDRAHSRLDAFESIALPTTEAASPVLAEGATLNATIFPESVATTYQFEYGPTTSYGSFALASPASGGSGMSPVHVAAPIRGLKPQTLYHYRVATVGNHGTLEGFDGTFTTLGPLATIGSASSTGGSTASFTGSVDARGIPGATYRFLVSSSSSAYTGATTEAPVPGGSGSVPVSGAIEGLPAGGTYSVRLLASGKGASAYSEPVTFATPPVIAESLGTVPNISTNPYTGLTITPPTTPPATRPPLPGKPSVKKTLTKAQKLSKALKQCKKVKRKTKRQTCAKQAHKQFGPTPKAKKTTRGSHQR